MAQLHAQVGPTLVTLVVLLTLGLAPTPGLRLDDELVADMPWPTSFTFTGAGRMLVTNQTGELRVVRDGALVHTPALDLEPRLCSSAERGLLGRWARHELASGLGSVVDLGFGPLGGGGVEACAELRRLLGRRPAASARTRRPATSRRQRRCSVS